MQEMIRQNKIEDIEFILKSSIIKCCTSLSVNITNDMIDTLIEDILEVYETDAITDVLSAIKGIRQSEYGKTYRMFDMGIIRESMASILEKKAILREREHNNKKKELKTELQEVDYKAYLERMSQPKKTNIDEEYEKFKHKRNLELHKNKTQ